MLQYFAGKTFTYAMLGGIAGLAGTGIAAFGWSQALSITTGILFVIVGFNQLLRPKWWHHNALAIRAQSFISNLTAKAMAMGGKGSALLMGMLNGLLPCGLVYLGMIGSGATGNWLHGSWYMTLMGLGTIPAMLLFVGGVHAAGNVWRYKAQKMIPYVILLAGFLLVLRGVGLGIPYLSPEFSSAGGDEIITCH